MAVLIETSLQNSAIRKAGVIAKFITLHVLTVDREADGICTC